MIKQLQFSSEYNTKEIYITRIVFIRVYLHDKSKNIRGCKEINNRHSIF